MVPEGPVTEVPAIAAHPHGPTALNPAANASTYDLGTTEFDSGCTTPVDKNIE